MIGNFGYEHAFSVPEDGVADEEVKLDEREGDELVVEDADLVDLNDEDGVVLLDLLEDELDLDEELDLLEDELNLLDDELDLIDKELDLVDDELIALVENEEDVDLMELEDIVGV
jgi:hypothetical protein